MGVEALCGGGVDYDAGFGFRVDGMTPYGGLKCIVMLIWVDYHGHA